jgi:hypothetical protein
MNAEMGVPKGKPVAIVVSTTHPGLPVNPLWYAEMMFPLVVW